VKAQGEGSKQKLACGHHRKKLITSTDYRQAGVNHDERSKTKRIRSSLLAIKSNGNGGWDDG